MPTKLCTRCNRSRKLKHFSKSGRYGYQSWCKECHQEYRATIRRVNGRGTDKRFSRYQITIEEFQQLLDAQGNQCAICTKPDPNHLDHDHTTGKIRGILCPGCNCGLGFFKDNITTLREAIKYLENNN